MTAKRKVHFTHQRNNSFHVAGCAGSAKKSIRPATPKDPIQRTVAAIADSLNQIGKSTTGIAIKGQWHLLDDLTTLMKKNRELITEKNTGDILRFFQNWVFKLMSTTDDDKRKYQGLFMQSDVTVLFPFLEVSTIMERKGITDKKEFRQCYNDCVDLLNASCPHREGEIRELVRSVFFRMLGVTDITFPLLLGGPGTGKTEIARLLQVALNGVGIRTEFIFQSMTETNSTENGSQSEMKLLGTDDHWGNAKPGKIFTACQHRDVDLCLVLLDEADKHSHSEDLMINLLDPVQPLQDTFISSICERMDMRHKVFFMLSANDERPLNLGNDNPLWSRLSVIDFKPYTKPQLVDLLVQLSGRNYKDIPWFFLDRNHIRNLATTLVDRFGAEHSLRSYLNQINRILGNTILGVETVECSDIRMPVGRKKIGF